MPAFTWLLVALLCLSSGSVLACTCLGGNLPDEERIAFEAQRARFVLLARVQTVTRTKSSVGSDQVVIEGTASPIEVYKAEGDVPSQLAFRIVLRAYSDSCTTGGGAQQLENGSVVVLYLSEAVITSESFHYCTRSGVLPDDYENSADVRHLRSIYKPGASSRKPKAL